MTDRELLVSAANVAGIELPWSHDKLAAFQYSATYWNPLDEDGDALRLAVRLGRLGYWAKMVVAFGNSTAFEARDPYSATRRAIVEAAAMLEKQDV